MSGCPAISSQNHICEPSLREKRPKLRNLSFTPIRLVQKYESPGFLLTCPRVLLFRYLLVEMHVPQARVYSGDI